MRTIGFILAGLGLVALLYSGFTFTTKEKVVDLGPIDINKEKKHSINWPPVTGAVLVVIGITLVIVDKRKLA